MTVNRTAYIAGTNYWFFWLISFCPIIACNVFHRKLITHQSILSSFFSKGLNEVLYPIMCLIQLSSLPKKQRIIVSHLLPLGRDRYRLWLTLIPWRSYQLSRQYLGTEIIQYIFLFKRLTNYKDQGWYPSGKYDLN